MVRTVRWLGIIALVAAPVAAWLGRPMQRGCDEIFARHGPCDPYYVSASWEIPLTLSIAALGIGFLIVAWLVERNQIEDDA